jgi:MFS family permease
VTRNTNDGWRDLVRAAHSRWAVLSFVTLLYWVVNQAVRPFLPIRLEELGASDPVIGGVVAGYSIAGLLLAVPSGLLLDRLPQHRLLLISLVGLGISTASFMLTQSVIILAVLMLANGAFGMWVWLVLQSMITHAGHGENRRRQLTLFSLAWGVGLAGGPTVGALLYDFADFVWLCGALGLLSFGAAAVALAVPRVWPAQGAVGEGDEENPGLRHSMGRALDNPVLVTVLLSSFITVFVLSVRISFYPLYLERAGVSLPQVGFLLSLIGFVSLGVRGVLPPVMRRFGMLPVLIWSTWAAIIGMVLAPVSTQMWFLVLGAVLMGVGLGANPPITVNLIAEHSDAQDRGLAVGLRMVANRSGQVTQPLLFGGVAAGLGLAVAFPVAGVALGALTIWMSLRLRRLRS